MLYFCIKFVKIKFPTMKIVSMAASGVGGLVIVVLFTILLVHRVKKSNEGS